MPPSIAELPEQLALNPTQFLGIPFALVGAVFLSVGAQMQHHGVSKVESRTQQTTGGLNVRQLWLLLRRPSWVVGQLLIFLAIAFQLVSLAFSPLIVVQPLGAIALVVTALLNSRISKIKLNRQSVISIIMCISGVGLFVVIAAFTAVDTQVTNRNLITILIILTFVVVIFVVAFILFRHGMRPVAYIIAAGVLYGFVATLAKAVISRVQQQDFDWLTALCVVGLLGALLGGAYLVQTAYSVGPPDLVIAGLTVIDPLVAVCIGIVVLGEAAHAGSFAALGYLVTAAIAIVGVFGLARYHPQTQALAQR